MKALTVKQALEDGLSLIKSGWTKGDWTAKKRGHDCYCALGAVRKAIYGNARGEYNATDEEHALYREVQPILAKAVAPRSRKPAHLAFSVIINFNDAKTTKKADVLKAFRRAIAKAA